MNEDEEEEKVIKTKKKTIIKIKICKSNNMW